MTQICYGEEDINCASIMTLLANCYTKTQDYDQALEYISKVNIYKLHNFNLTYRFGIFQKPSMVSSQKVVLLSILKLQKYIQRRKTMKKQSNIRKEQ